MSIFLFVFLIIIFHTQSQYQSGPYAQWAHSHVIWYNNTQNQNTILAMAKNYIKYQIPFGGFNIDSGWSTCYNDFIWNKSLFPDAKGLIDYFHSINVRVILWATSVVNTDCPNYKQGKDKGYFLNGGKTIKWWHGHGAFVDLFNPQAKNWWQSQMDKVINMGIDGWKCDGTDPMTVLLRPWPYSSYLKRYILPQEYSNQYYGTFYNYTKSKNPETLIMARPIDSFHQKSFIKYAPKYVMFSGWVGDQDASADGMRQALANCMHSAWKGYLNFGFDIGGYRGNKMRISKSIFLRWVQVGALVPFMQNGGNGPHQPWAFDQQTTNIYRKFVLIHYDLKKFFYTSGTQAYKKGVSVIQPLAKKQSAITLRFLDTYGFMLWNTFIVFPIFEETGIAELKIPSGQWIYYFDHNYIIDRSVTSRAFPLDKFPIFIKKGAIYPIYREYLDLPYMENFKLKNSHLNKEELVLVYLQKGSHNRTFYAKDHTDYVTINFTENYLELRVDRFYKDQREQNTNEITIRAIGAKNQIDQLSIEKGRNLKQSIYQREGMVVHKFDQSSANDLLFTIELNKFYTVYNLEFKQTKINEDALIQ